MTDDSPTSRRDVSDGRPPTDERTFEEPWQARAFALAVALTDERDLDWERFQSRLVAAVDESTGAGAADSETTYYRQWLAALERLLVEEDLVDAEDLRDRVAAFAAGERTAHEFVRGDPHAHADRLPDDHAEGSHHDHHDHDHDHDHDH